MEASELNKILEAYNHKLEKKISLNRSSLLKLNLEKPKKHTQTILVYRLIEMISFSFLMIFLGRYIVANWSHTHIAVSAIVVNVFVLIALIGSIGQVVLLYQIDFAKPIVDIRKKIEIINTHELLFLKIMFLSIPVWWAYSIVGLDVFIGVDLFVHLDPDFVIRYLVANFLLLIPLVWVLNKLSYKNLHIKWVKKTIEVLTGKRTRKALSFLHDIESFES